MPMITATTWVPRGCAAPFPTKHEFNEEEYDRIAKLARLQLDDAKEDLEEAQKAQNETSNGNRTAIETSKTNGEVDEDLKEYDLENYDEDKANDSMDEDVDTMGMFGNAKSLVYHGNEEDDPYITMKGEEDEDEEREELQILSTDNLVLAARIEDEVAHLEVYVYEDAADNLYVHHDLMLPAIPLAVEWIDLPVGKQGMGADSRGSFVAVGTMDPDIELWDLDLVDCVYPNAILGQGGDEPPAEDSSKERKKKRKHRKSNDEYHVDAVLSLAANRQHRNLLASSSADKTVKLWDMNTAKCAKSYRYHDDKVCAIAWHPLESTVLLSGSYDSSVVASDMRAPDQGIRRWTVDSDVENIQWDPHDSNYFYTSTESGLLHYFDARVAPTSSSSVSEAVWKLQAHDESLSSFDVNSVIPGFIATGSTDKQVKLWNVQPTGPSMIVSRDLGVGKVFSTRFAPDAEVGFRLAVAGSKGSLQIWDTSTNAAIRSALAGRVTVPAGGIKERLVGLSEEGEDEDEDEDEDHESEEQE